MNQLVYPKCGLMLPYSDLGLLGAPGGGEGFPGHLALSPRGVNSPDTEYRTDLHAAPGRGTTFPGHTALSTRGATGPYAGSNRKHSPGRETLKRRNGSEEDEHTERKWRGMNKVERRMKNKARKSLEKEHCFEKDQNERLKKDKSTHPNTHIDRKSEGQIQQHCPESTSLVVGRTVENTSEGKRRKNKGRTEVRAASDIHAGVILGPYPAPEPFLLGVDLEDEEGEVEQTIWVSTLYCWDFWVLPDL